MTSYKPLIVDFASVGIKEELYQHMQDPETDSLYLSAIRFAIAWLDNSQAYFEFTTSGSTGKPKPILVSRERVICSVEATAAYFSIKRGDKVFVCLNADFTGGKMMLARALHLGLIAHIVPPTNLNLLLKDDFVLTAFVPNQLYTILQGHHFDSFLSNFKNILVGGAALSNELLSKIRPLQGPKIYETFGMTETLSHIALKHINEQELDASFELLPGVEIRTDENKCLMVRAKVTNNEWIKTNDIVELENERQFVWRGRFDNVINSGGVKIYPEEIERLIAPILIAEGCQADFFLTSVPDVKLGEKLVLVLEGEDVPIANILNALKLQLPKYQSPSEVYYKKSFERTSSGKIIRSF